MAHARCNGRSRRNLARAQSCVRPDDIEKYTASASWGDDGRADRMLEVLAGKSRAPRRKKAVTLRHFSWESSDA